MSIKPVILSGGSGTRLWPASRKSLPKQFIEFPGIGSLFALTLKRATEIAGDDATTLVISSRQHSFLCRKAAAQLGIEAHYILEETGRNTAPAIYIAALASDPDDILLIMPSDHWIEDMDLFAGLVRRGVEACSTGKWLSFGITPSEPATGYGYIEVAPGAKDLVNVQSFTEKPDAATAQGYVASGRHYWNSGIFMVRAGSCSDSFHRHQPDLAKAASSCWDARTQRPDEDILVRSALEAVPSISVDYAIMEKEDRIMLLAFDGGWSDVGSWDSLAGLISATAPDRDAGATLIDSTNVFVHSKKRTIAGVGLQDLIIIDDDDATLIVRRGQTEKVKNVIEQLVSTNNAAAIEHSFEYRPWGMFENLLESSACKVKRLTVDPKQNLSLQYHHKRSEHWVVVEGIATVQIDGKVLTLEAGEAVDIPLGAHHALGNNTEDPVVVIEIQMGSYFGEDDIVRVSDPYGR